MTNFTMRSIRQEEFDKDYLLKLDYPEHLWMEKEIKSVANVTHNEYLSSSGDLLPLPTDNCPLSQESSTFWIK